jgi:2-oxoisovalerate dehydrogenase E2 component (dihydrolipoyl transacylase)
MPSVLMPQPGQSVTEGTVLRWLKQVGDSVVLDEVLVEVETEKVNVEVPSPFEGPLTAILVAEGETVPVGAALAVVGEPDDAALAARSPAPTDIPALERAATVGLTDGGPPADGGSPVDGAAAAVVAPPPASAAPAAVTTNGAGGPARYSPAVLTLAAEHGIDLARITGTGMNGRVTRKDVQRVIDAGGVAMTPAAPPAPPAVAAPPVPLREAPAAAPAPATPAVPAAASAPPSPAAALAADETVMRPSATRLSIARTLTQVTQTVPVAWMAVEVDVTGLVRLRERQREAFRAREGVDLTYLPFVIQAVVAALREHPMLNSEWRDETIVLKKRLNIGIAVGIDEGTVVPVVHDADRLSISGLAHAITDLAARARARQLRMEDVSGGTFTVDNTGVFGALVSKPILVPRQTGILATDAIVRRPVVREDAIAIRSIMNLSLTFDHRVADGVHVGPFMQAVRARLESVTPDTPIT